MGVDEPFAGLFGLTKSQSVLKNEDIQRVTGATVTLREESNCSKFFEDLPECTMVFEEGVPGLYSSRSGLEPLAGQTYTLQIEKDGFKPIEATTTIPYPVKIKEVAFDTVSLPPTSSSARNTRISEIRLTFDDPLKEHNYYEVEVEGLKAKVECDSVGNCELSSSSFSGVRMLMNSQDPAVVNSNYELQGLGRIYGRVLPFNDELFDGETYTLHFDPNAYFYGDSLYRSLTIRLKSVTEEQYEYTYASWLQRTARENRYAEPVLVPNNIKNGYGIFAGYSVDEARIRLP